MVIDFFLGLDRRYFCSLLRARVRYKSEDQILVLFFEHAADSSIPYTWLQGLSAIVVDERDKSYHALDVQWLDTDGFLLCAKAACPTPFHGSNREFVPIDRIILQTPRTEYSFPNIHSTQRMRGR